MALGGLATTPAVTGSPVTTGAGVLIGSNTIPTGTTSSPKPTSTSNNSVFGNLSNGAVIGIVVGGIIVLSMTIFIWKRCKARIRNSLDKWDRSNAAGPSVLPAYIPTNIPIYEPAPTRAHGYSVYDPVLERHTAVGTITPPPLTPSPAYSAVEQHNMSEERGLIDPVEVHGVGSTRGRVEMA